MLRPFSFALAVFAAGCPAPPVERPATLPSAEQLVTHLRERAAKLARLRTEAKVDYLEENGQRIKLTMTFVTERPDKLRIDAESPLGGATIASLATDGKRFQLVEQRHNRVLVGDATPCALGRLLRIQLAPADLIDIVDGAAPLLGQPSGVAWDPQDGGREVLTLVRPDGGKETIKLSPKTWDVTSAEVSGANGKPLYRLTHDDFSTIEGGGPLRFPGKTQIFDPGHAADAKIRYRSRDLDPKLPDGVFQLAPPPGLPVETISCGP